jgi:hypothetical protein
MAEESDAISLGPRTILVLSIWCGFVSGLLEVGATILRKNAVGQAHFYWRSRHFVWLIPATNVLLFLALGLILCVVTALSRRRRGQLAVRLLCALTLLPALLISFSRIYGLAWFVVAIGVAARLVGILWRHWSGFTRLVRLSFPVVAAVPPVLAASIWVEDRIKEWHAASRQTPAPKSPNVLLLVLDTVAASHLSLYGYNRPRSPTIDEHPDVFCHGTSLYQTELHVPLRTDSRETQNLADDPKWLAVLERMRQKPNELTAGPLTTRRFNL